MAVTNYIWDELSDSVLMETDGSGATTAVYTQERGPFGGLISERRGNESRYYHYDGLGSTRQLTDATGQTTDTYLYEAYGQFVQTSGTTVNPFRFVGRLGYYFDQELSEYYVRARHYDPRLARWLAVDPIGFRAGTNLYEYVGDSPLAHIDPQGTITQEQCQEASGKAKENMRAYLDAMRKVKPPCFVMLSCLNKKQGNCPQGIAGYYEGEASSSVGRILKVAICYEIADSVAEAEEWFAHEIVHAFDSCSGCKRLPTKEEREKGEVPDCDQIVCSELRAASLSGQCLPGAVYMEELSKILGHPATREECVVASAFESLQKIKHCQPNATESIKRLLKKSYVEKPDPTNPSPWPPFPPAKPRASPPPKLPASR